MFDLAAEKGARVGGGEAASHPNADTPQTRDAQSIVNWNELLRKAKEKKQQLGWSTNADTTRSAIGIVDTNDLMRQAKAKKDGRTGQ